MFVEVFKADGLAHLSYLVGNGGVAAVIDPRRDCAGYVDAAAARGCRITHICETHRNEDLISGAPTLAAMTGAEVLHGPSPDAAIVYARTIHEGHAIALGSFRLVALETPGHTDDSLSYALYDETAGPDAVGVFTGDALFVGDVGRTDFYPDRARQVAGLLYDSLQKLLALGDQAIVYPAHGAGSVCGGGISAREFSTIGSERRSNPMLQCDRDSFIEAKLAEHHYQPPYFRLMERLNAEGGSPVPTPAQPTALASDAFEATPAKIVDVRSTDSYRGAHLPGSLSIPTATIPAFAGWLLDPDEPVKLVADDAEQARTAARHLARIGYDRIAGALDPGLSAWAAEGRRFASLPVVNDREVAYRLDQSRDNWTLLDVRGKPEVEEVAIDGATHIYAGELPGRLDDLDNDQRITTMCASGVRATIAASVLRRSGFTIVDVFLGSMAAWQAAGRPTV